MTLPLRSFRTVGIALPALLLALPACEPRVADATATNAPPALSAAVGAAPQDTAATARISRADLGRIKGAESARVWLIVVSDYQCPYCKRWHEETAPRIEREYVKTGKVRIAYLNYPIASHRNAGPAHDAAMCASEQGAFWAMSDAIFATQTAWKDRSNAIAYFDSLAGTLKIDRARQRACVSAGGLRPLIEADLDRAVRRGIGSTPTFFVGSRMVVGAQPFEAFRDAIDKELAALPAAPR